MDIPSNFRLAKNVSKFSEHRYPMGSVIIKNGKPFAVGFNKVKSHPEAWHNGLHAEMAAIKTCDRHNLEGCSIVVYRETKNGDIGNARPCSDCLKELKKRGFKRMFYTTKEYPFFEEENLIDYDGVPKWLNGKDF